MPDDMQGSPASTPRRLLWVCTGNICRSPMAEGYGRWYAGQRGWRVESRSASVLGLNGRKADPLAIKVMREEGIDIDPHRAQPMSQDLADWANYILVMEMAHAVKIRERHPGAEDKVLLLGNFGGLVEIDDPIGGWRWKFRRSRDIIKTCVVNFMDQMPPVA